MRRCTSLLLMRKTALNFIPLSLVVAFFENELIVFLSSRKVVAN